MESGLAASKKGLLKKQCPFTGCRAGDAGGGFYSMPSEGPAGTKRHFQSLRTPRLCRGTWLKKPPDVRRKRLRPPAPGKAVCGQRLSGTKALLPERPFPPLFSGRRQAEPFCGPRRVPAMRQAPSTPCIYRQQTHIGACFSAPTIALYFSPGLAAAAAIRRQAARRAPY